MRKSTSRITKLPPEVREEINRKMDSAWEYRAIRKWLFEQVAECDVPALGLVKGDSFSVAWVRAAKSTEHAWHHCELALGNWYRGQHQEWLRQQVQGSESMRIVKRAAALTKAAAEESGVEPRSQNRGETASDTVSGGDVLMRSVLIDAVSSIGDSPASLRDAAGGGRCDRREVAALANAWARLNAGKMEEEKLKLKTQSAFELACEGLGKEIKET